MPNDYIRGDALSGGQLVKEMLTAMLERNRPAAGVEVEFAGHRCKLAVCLMSLDDEETELALQLYDKFGRAAFQPLPEGMA